MNGCPDCSGSGFELTIAGRVVGVCGMCDGSGALPECIGGCGVSPDGAFVPEVGCDLHDTPFIRSRSKR